MSREDLKVLGDSLAHLSPSSVRDFYERAYQQCRIKRQGRLMLAVPLSPAQAPVKTV